MNIWIDTVQAYGSDGKVDAYYPEVHWTLDERDSISPDAMNKICASIRREVNDGLNEARSEK